MQIWVFENCGREYCLFLLKTLFLTGTGQANKKELQDARDLQLKLKDCLIELQSNFIEMEDGYKEYIQNLIEEKKNMRERGKERLNAFKNSKETQIFSVCELSV